MALSDYQGTNIEKAFGIQSHTNITPELIFATLDDNLQKGLIDKPLYDKAVEQLNALIEKAGKGKGEGSRGGHIIGHTKSGKPVYKGKDQASAKEYKDFSAQDHIDASKLHVEESYTHHGRMMRENRESHVSYAKAMHQHHVDAASSHAEAGSKLAKKEHESGLPSDEKKIIADQKKKQIDHHQRLHDFHDHIISAINQLPHPGLEGETARHMMEEFNRHKQARDHHKSEKERLEKE